MHLYKTDQIRLLDARTIEIEGIQSSELMDRAAYAIFKRMTEKIAISEKALIIAGFGNNGGDALAVARLMEEAGFTVSTVLCSFGKKLSKDATLQFERLKAKSSVNIVCPKTADELATACGPCDIILDGLFGSGLNRPLEGDFASVVHWINQQEARIISIDVPSGLFGEDNRSNKPENIVKSDLVIGLQFPRLAYLLPENEPFIKKWELVDIGIKKQAINELNAQFYFTDFSDIRKIIQTRTTFSHKGRYGKGLLISGSYGMSGAAILAAKGALRSGIGLLTVRIPSELMAILQTAVPEAMVQTYECGEFWDDTCSTDLWSAIAIGPGLGKSPSKRASMLRFLKKQPGKLVLDADALNIISEENSLVSLIPEGSILTPHPGEFSRLSGKTFQTGLDRLEEAISFAKAHKVYLVLKGAYTACINPDGICHFNCTGNPGMATGGSGDILTGIIVSLLAQGYSQENACILGTFLHGLSADIALEEQSQESLIAGDIANHLGNAFKAIRG